MTRILLTALVAATAMTAVAVDARTNARQRGVASGQEARERATTRDLNSQQLATVGAAAPASGSMAAPMDTGSPGMTSGAGSSSAMPSEPATGATTAPAADPMATPGAMTPPEAAPAPDTMTTPSAETPMDSTVPPR